MSRLGKRRVFFAVALDEPTRHLLAAHLSEHAPGGLPGTLVLPPNWHLTLRFVGWATDPQIDLLAHRAAEAMARRPFRVRFGGLGAFPKPRRATVLWVAVDSGGEAVGELAAACEEAAVATGFAPEDRPFHPHVTVSRVRPPIDAGPLVAGFPAFDVDMAVNEIALFESHLEQGGARYEVVERLSL